MDDDEAMITAAAHDYFDGYFDGDQERMRRALHPDLVKRGVGAQGASALPFITADQMITWTDEQVGVEIARGLTDRTIAVRVFDVQDDIASVLVRSEPYHEYLHMVRTSDGWRIANALYRNNPSS